MSEAVSEVMTTCQRCGLPLAEDVIVCPRCHGLAHAEELDAIAARAMDLESIHPLLAAVEWRQALKFLPAESPQHQWIVDRIASLNNGGPPAVPAEFAQAKSGATGGEPRQRILDKDETWQSILLKTGGSMILSMALFSSMGGWSFAVGLVLLIFVHEMGHVVANWYYGVRQSAPIFLGIFGAVIFLKGRLRNAWEEAVVGIAGPVFGTVAAFACYYWWLKTGNPLAANLAVFGFFINLWNLMPITPLDGGRTVAAITPFLWVLGLLGLGAFELRQVVLSFLHGHVSFWLLLILFYLLSQAWPQIRRTLFEGGWRSSYYQIGWPRRLVMCAIYGGLIVLLSTYWYSMGGARLIGL